MEKSNDKICFDGELVDAGTAVSPTLSRGLMYGEGVFDTQRIYKGRTLMFGRHFERLGAGMEALGIRPPGNFGERLIKKNIYDLLEVKDLLEREAVVRLQVWRDGSRGYKPDNEGAFHYSITASECPDRFPEPVLKTVDRKRIPSESLPSTFKFTNGINYILAAREAEEKGGDDALMKTTEGCISETTIANIFWSKGNSIYTPSRECDLLPGICRGILVDIIEENSDWTLNTDCYRSKDIRQAEQVWICNSVREVVAVRQLDDLQFRTGSKLLEELVRRFRQFRDERLNSLLPHG